MTHRDLFIALTSWTVVVENRGNSPDISDMSQHACMRRHTHLQCDPAFESTSSLANVWWTNDCPLAVNDWYRWNTVSGAVLLSGPCSFAVIGHQTLELLRSDWLNIEPLALDNHRPVCFTDWCRRASPLRLTLDGKLWLRDDKKTTFV